MFLIPWQGCSNKLFSFILLRKFIILEKVIYPSFLNQAIALAKTDQRLLGMAHFNRGNAKQNLKDMDGACADWKQSVSMGGAYAGEKLGEFCK